MQMQTRQSANFEAQCFENTWLLSYLTVRRAVLGNADAFNYMREQALSMVAQVSVCTDTS